MGPIIQRIQEQSRKYYNALDLSIKTAEVGFDFSTDSEYLCEFLLEPSSTVEELQDYISEMREKARHAHDDARHTSEIFRAVRQNLIQV
jgi:hypothetical protein